MKHRGHSGRVNATSWANAIFNSQPTPANEVIRIMVHIRTAYERLKSGTGTDDDFDVVGCAINVGMIRAEAIDTRLVDMFKAAGEALLEAQRLRDRHGRFGFTGPHILNMNAGMDLYEQVLSLSTPNQMHSAVEESCARIRKGEVISA